MHRIIFSLGGLQITSWGVMLVIAFITGIWFAEHRAKKYEMPRSIIPDLSLILIIAGVAGGRIAYIFENFSYYVEYPGEIFKVWEGGLIFYGGFVLAVLCGIIFLKNKKVPFFAGPRHEGISMLKVMDIVAPSVALGLGFARIGCFLNGCCFGKPTNLPWGVVFPPGSPPTWVFDKPISIHPTQLYSSLAGFCMVLLLLIIEKNKKKRIPGHLFCFFLVLYSGWRFFIDFLRFYDPRAYIMLGLTHNQVASIFIFLVFIGVLLKNEFLERHI